MKPSGLEYIDMYQLLFYQPARVDRNRVRVAGEFPKQDVAPGMGRVNRNFDLHRQIKANRAAPGMGRVNRNW